MGASTLSTALRLDGISKRLGSRWLIRDIDVQVAAGEVVGLLGPNGAGKTTLLKIATGQTRPSTGTVELLGTLLDRSGRLPPRVGVMVEQPTFIEHATGSTHLAVMADLGGYTVDIPDVLRAVGLDPRDRRTIRRYSLGMRQRLAMAQMLLSAPRLAVLDEPTNGLDAMGIVEFRQLVVHLAASGTGVLLSSHLLGEVERSCDRVVILRAGELLHDLHLRDRHTNRVRIGFAGSNRHPELAAVVPLSNAATRGEFVVFDTPWPIEQVVAAAVAGGISIRHASMEPLDLERLVLDVTET